MYRRASARLRHYRRPLDPAAVLAYSAHGRPCARDAWFGRLRAPRLNSACSPRLAAHAALLSHLAELLFSRRETIEVTAGDSRTRPARPCAIPWAPNHPVKIVWRRVVRAKLALARAACLPRALSSAARSSRSGAGTRREHRPRRSNHFRLPARQLRRDRSVRADRARGRMVRRSGARAPPQSARAPRRGARQEPDRSGVAKLRHGSTASELASA